jgi:hypothetical protein
MPTNKNEMLNLVNLSLADADPCIKIENNLVTQPLGQALFLVAFGPVSVVGNQFTSQGVFEANRLSTLGACVCILDLGISKDLVNVVMASGGKFKNLAMLDPTSVLATEAGTKSILGNRMGAYQLLASGKVLFAANQTTMDMRSPEIDRLYAAHLIASLDDVAFTTNQAECASMVSLQQSGLTLSDKVLYNTWLLGISLRCNDNRFTDGYSFTSLSLFTIAPVNTTTDNQATHCIKVVGYPTLEVDVHNTVILPASCKDRANKLGLAFGMKATAVSVHK